MLLVELKLSRVFDGHDAVLDRDEARKHVEEGRLTGAGASRHDDVGLREHSCLQESKTSLVAGAETNEVLDLEGIARKLADGEQRAVKRERPDDRVDAGTIGEPGVAERRALVDAAAHGADDELDDVEELILIDELDVGENDLARHFNVDVVAPVDHDFGDAVVADQGLDRP